MKKGRIGAALVLALGILVITASTCPALETIDLKIKPSGLALNTFFSGETALFSGEINKNQDVALEIVGPSVKSAFNVMGRIGPFWMNRDQAEIENAPGFYVLLLPEQGAWRDNLGALDLGLGKYEKDVKIEAGENEPEKIFNLFVELKESEGVFNEQPGAVKYEAGSDGKKLFNASFDFPSSTSLGLYQVRAVIIENGARVGTIVKDFPVQETGFVKLVHNMALNQGLLYGVLSVLIALFTGLVMGVLFRKSGGAH